MSAYDVWLGKNCFKYEAYSKELGNNGQCRSTQMKSTACRHRNYYYDFLLSFVFHYCRQWEIIYFSAQLILFPKDHFKKPLLSTSGRLRKIRPVVERMVWMVESHPVPKRFLRKNTTLRWCTCYVFESTNDMLSIETSLLSWEGRHSPLCVDEKF